MSQKYNLKLLNKKESDIKEEINLNNLKWSLTKKKSIQERFKIGDIIFVKKENNFWNLKQYPKVNGGIVVLDPYRWKCESFSWRIQF